MKPNLPKVKRILKKANPNCEIKVSWDKKPFESRGGWFARVKVEAAGYRTKLMSVMADNEGCLVK
jgi:hypothetical protein